MKDLEEQRFCLKLAKMILKQKLNCCSGWENLHCGQKQHVRVLADHFLWEGFRSSCVCSTWSDSQWTVLLRDHTAFEEGRAKEET
jgi:hypothetical protein